MNLHPNILNAFQEIDAALFSGDSFYSPENKKELERYILRWNKELKILNENALHSARYILEDLNHSEGIKKLSEINGLPEGVIFEAFKNIFSENEK